QKGRRSRPTGGCGWSGGVRARQLEGELLLSRRAVVVEETALELRADFGIDEEDRGVVPGEDAVTGSGQVKDQADGPVRSDDEAERLARHRVLGRAQGDEGVQCALGDGNRGHGVGGAGSYARLGAVSGAIGIGSGQLDHGRFTGASSYVASVREASAKM